MTALDPKKIIVVDLETGGLDPQWHPIWEMSWAVWEPTVFQPSGEWNISTTFVAHDPSHIDPWVLENTGYAERYVRQQAILPMHALALFALAAEGRHIVGMVPSFDEERIRLAYRENIPGASHSTDFGWHYHLIDAETFVVGYLAGTTHSVITEQRLTLPWSSDDLSRAVGVNPDDFPRHTAEGDVRWTISILAAIGALPPLETP